MYLPQKLPLEQMQPKWASILNPVLANPMTNMAVLKNISLKAGTNVINHLLGSVQQGWILTDINSSAVIYRSAPFNDKTLTLTASAPCTVSIGVF